MLSSLLPVRPSGHAAGCARACESHAAGARAALAVALFAGVSSIAALPAHAQSAPAQSAPPANDDFTANIGGRVHWDFAAFDNDDRGAPNRNDIAFRRLWLDVNGRAFGFGYKVEVDFGGLQDDFSNRGLLARDVFINRRFGKGLLTVGQFKPYFTLDDRSSSNFMPFIERSAAGNFIAPIFRKGVAWLQAEKQGTWSAYAYSLESIDISNVNGNAFGGRATWAPNPTTGDVLHLGLSLARERYDRPGAPGVAPLVLAQRPAGWLSLNSRLTMVRFADGIDTTVDKWSVEYAQVRGPVSWQSEYSGGFYDSSTQRAAVRAAYGFVSWFPTGESRGYDAATGRFGRLESINNPRGALELVLRYDRIWSDQNAIGGPALIQARSDTWTVGANWYFTPTLRVMVNLIDGRNRNELTDATTDHTRAIYGRFHYNF